MVKTHEAGERSLSEVRWSALSYLKPWLLEYGISTASSTWARFWKCGRCGMAGWSAVQVQVLVCITDPPGTGTGTGNGNAWGGRWMIGCQEIRPHLTSSFLPSFHLLDSLRNVECRMSHVATFLLCQSGRTSVAQEQASTSARLAVDAYSNPRQHHFGHDHLCSSGPCSVALRH